MLSWPGSSAGVGIGGKSMGTKIERGDKVIRRDGQGPVGTVFAIFSYADGDYARVSWDGANPNRDKTSRPNRRSSVHVSKLRLATIEDMRRAARDWLEAAND